MRKIAFLTVFLALVCVCTHAETIVLRTGTRVQGTIVFQNEEVVIVRNAEGQRFQYMRADVASIETSEGSVQQSDSVAEAEPEIQVQKKASILLELAGGSACMPGENFGGAASVDLLVGSHHIKDRHVFVGGGVGYHGVFLGADKYNFLPIQAAVRMPLTEEKHAPMFGVAVGYGVALSKDYLGGLYAGADFGYRCQLNPKTAIALVFYTQFQQARVNTTVTIDEQEFTNKVGRSLVNFGGKFALYF